VFFFKQVLPALIPGLSYNKLNIQSGESSRLTFLSMVNKKFKGNELTTRKDLLEYCKLDTYAMVKIVDRLFEL